MKTMILTSILALSFSLLTINSNAEGVVIKAANTITFHKICEFAFSLDPSQIAKSAETADLSDLTLQSEKLGASKSKTANPLPFAFKLDVNQINKEAREVDLSDLNSK